MAKQTGQGNEARQRRIAPDTYACPACPHAARQFLLFFLLYYCDGWIHIEAEKLKKMHLQQYIFNSQHQNFIFICHVVKQT